MGTVPTPMMTGKVLSCVDGDLMQQGGAPHPTWPQDICQRSGHIFWHSTECKRMLNELWGEGRERPPPSGGSLMVCFPRLAGCGSVMGTDDLSVFGSFFFLDL